MKRTILLAMLIGCAEQPAVSDLEQQTTVCGVGPTVKGIDVSYYQGTINWTSVKADGVVYAFIRVSDGTYNDPNFATYWADSRAAGIKHGAYQFFEPGDDAITQADLLLSKIGTLQPDDLPPVLDVETTGGLAASAVAAGVKKWVDYVAGKIGRPPIIYTGMYFWQDNVGGPNMSTSPLWQAQYTTAACPDIAPSWPTWAFWQYTSTGTVSGINGSVDVDRWNGNTDSFNAFLGPAGTCGDGTCDAGETKNSCPEDCGPCGTVAAAGGIVDDSQACFEAGGPEAYMRKVTDAGQDGGLTWTHTTSDATEANFGQWDLYLAAAGNYEIQVSTAAAYAQSKQAEYVVHTATGDTKVKIDQTAVDGWQTLGAFDLAAGGHQFVHLGDNTGEPSAGNIQLVFDAVQLTPTDGTGGDGSGSGSDDGSGDDDPTAPKHAGCSVGGNGAGLVLAAMLVGLRRRRRR